jgi:hypothetical protein
MMVTKVAMFAELRVVEDTKVSNMPLVHEPKHSVLLGSRLVEGEQ